MNNLVVVSGPSGSGKSTLVNALLKDFPSFGFSVSHTTRPPREGEEDGREYYFISREAFLKRIREHAFAEWAEVHNNLYGTTIGEVKKKSRRHEFLVMDIDVQGVLNLKKKIQDFLSVFILPPSVAELRNRLLKRRSDSSANIQLRLKIAMEEIKQVSTYDYVIVNDDFDSAYASLRSIMIANRHRVIYNEDRIREFLGDRR